MVAATLMPFFIIMCELFNGILQPHQNMPVFWKYTMYYMTPFTYWIGGVLTSVLRGMPVICDSSELTIFESPSNMTCGEYAGSWLTEHGVGYLSNPDDFGSCGYCEYSVGDDVCLFSSFLPFPCSIIYTSPMTSTDKNQLVPRKNRAQLLKDLALLWHFRGVCDLQLSNGLFAGVLAHGQRFDLAQDIAV